MDFPDRRWRDDEVSSIVGELMQRFQTRDDKMLLREALLFRRTWNEIKTGQYVPPPFNNSPSLIKHATGILMDRTIHLASKVAENPVNYRVNVITSSSGKASAAALTAAGNQQDALDALEWQSNTNSIDPMQEIAAFYAVTLGVGWYHSYENEMGWAVPSRIYYDELTEEEAEQLLVEGKITSVLDDDKFRYAESADLWERRKQSAMVENADKGESLFVDEVLHPASVYYRKDSRGISMAAIVEEVPAWDMHDEFGIVTDEQGNIIIGADEGGPSGRGQIADKTWIRVRLWTREEVYYYVSRHQTGRPSGVGHTVWHSRHDYGEVPLWPAMAAATGSSDPAEEYVPILEGAYAMIPGYNQVITLLSNAAVFNTSPRYIILTADGAPVLDPNSSEPLVLETDNIAGLDPQFAAVIQNGGSFQQLKIENVDDIVRLLEVYSAQLDQTLPPEAATGASSQYEPAWGTRLKQAAANVKIHPVVTNHARAKTLQGRHKSRVIKNRGRPVTIFGRPKRRKQDQLHARQEITLKPEDISLNISVHQDDNDAQERITRMQVGVQLMDGQHISPLRFHDEFMGSDDPLGDLVEAAAWTLAMTVFQQTMVPRILERVQGRIAPQTPNEIQSEAEMRAQPRPDVQSANPAEAAGVRAPGLGMASTQDALPQLSGQGAGPVNGSLPV